MTLSFWRRLRRGTSDQPRPRPPEMGTPHLPEQPRPHPLPARVPGRPITIPAVGRAYRVAGVSFHRDALAAQPVGRTPLDLRADPDNPYGSGNTVAVACGNQRIGFLSSHMSQDYGPIVRRLEAEGPVSCSGWITDTEHGLGAEVDLPDSERLQVWANTAPDLRNRVGFERLRVRVKRQREYQAQLIALANGQEQKSVSALIEALMTSSGKYRGETALRFSAGGVEFGTIPAQWRYLSEPLFEAVEEQGSVVNDVWIYHRDGEAFAFLDYYPPRDQGP